MIGAAVIGICILALIARVFFKLLKFVILVVIIGVIAGFAWTQLQPRAQRVPESLVKPSPQKTNSARR